LATTSAGLRFKARLALWLAAAASGAAAAGSAADRITLQPEQVSGLIGISGEVLDWTAEHVTFRGADTPAPRLYNTSEVVAVETSRTAEHLRGLEQRRQGDIPAAIAAFEAALKTEGRAWLQREILAELVACHQRRQELGRAAGRFVQIIESEPHHRHWGLAPLGWLPQPPPVDVQAAARRWLLHPQPGVRLTGASLLLGDSTARLSALAELKKLERLPDRYVGSLAQAVVWGATLSTNVTSPEELLRWEREVDRMPLSLRGGPWFIIGRTRQHRNEPEEAAAAYLRVLLVHHEDDALAARSGLEAGLALQRLNRDAEARTVLREVIDRYPWSDAANEARQRLAPPAG